MAKVETRYLYAGHIEIGIGDLRIKPKRIRVRKELTTLTDSFDFTVPFGENARDFYIPNIFGLTIDVYINDEFYTSGILINRKVINGELTIECSTHGWQLSNSDIVAETEYQGNSSIGDFILDTCNTNLKETYAYSYDVFSDTKVIGKPQEEITKYIDNDLISKIEKEKIFFEDLVVVYRTLRKIVRQKKYSRFIIYDPFSLSKTVIVDPTNEKSEKQTIKAELNETVFDYIKKVTKNMNIFVKCIGLYRQIKDKLIDRFVYDYNNYGKEFSNEVYVLLLFRPGISVDEITKINMVQAKQGVAAYYENNLNIPSMQTKFTYYSYPNYYTAYKFEQIPGFVNHNKNEGDNCLGEVTEEYSGINEYSVYTLRSKNIKDDSIRINDIKDQEAIKELKSKSQYYDDTRFDDSVKLGNIKNIIVEEDFTLKEVLAKRRLNYEVNNMKAKSYKLSAKVIGYTIDMTVQKTYKNEQKNSNVFWDVNKVVFVNSPDQFIVNKRLIVGSLEMCYDESGAYTNLTLIPPLSYNASELNLQDRNSLSERELKEQQKINSKYKLSRWKILYNKNDKIIFDAKRKENAEKLAEKRQKLRNNINKI